MLLQAALLSVWFVGTLSDTTGCHAHPPTLLQMLEQVLSDADLPEDQAVCAPRLMGVVLQHCKGRVDHCVGEPVGGGDAPMRGCELAVKG